MGLLLDAWKRLDMAAGLVGDRELLHAAVTRRKVDVIRVLLERGAQVAQVDGNRQTLYRAVMCRYWDVVEGRAEPLAVNMAGARDDLCG